jgi:exodeoxyribonuclease VII large subunit
VLPGWDAVEGAGGAGGAGGGDTDAAASRRVRSVSDVALAIRQAVRGDAALRDLWVEGDVSRFVVSSAGHAYFTLKDARSQLQCVWFRDARVRSSFQPESGLQVLARGRIDVFEQQGAVQLYVEAMQPAGQGNLALQIEELKARLAAEGLFDASRKQPLPIRPAVIAIVTSPTGAVWRDVRNVLARRWPLASLVVVPCLVQGPGAASSIVGALDRLAAFAAAEVAAGRGASAPAVTILARGGGSPEDLAAFSDERVVRAVAAHPLPLVTGVGHEVDVTLVDFAADVRAPTPSAAAELVVPDAAETLGQIRATGRRAAAAVSRETAAARRGLEAERRVLGRLEPRAQLAASRERVGLLLDRASTAVAERFAADRRELAALENRPRRVVLARLAGSRSALSSSTGSLAVLGPEATLRRGYAIVRRAVDGALVREASAAPAGTALVISLESGRVAATSDGPPRA